MERALSLASESVTRGTGPFGAVVVRDGVVIAEAWNQVTELNDPTAHAEIQAIRAACKTLGTFHLGDCILYTSSHPCPMCHGAIEWARISNAYYANTLDAAAAVGFDDIHMYHDLCSPEYEWGAKLEHLVVAGAEKPFKEWQRNPRKVPY